MTQKTRKKNDPLWTSTQRTLTCRHSFRNCIQNSIKKTSKDDETQAYIPCIIKFQLTIGPIQGHSAHRGLTILVSYPLEHILMEHTNYFITIITFLLTKTNMLRVGNQTSCNTKTYYELPKKACSGTYVWTIIIFILPFISNRSRSTSTQTSLGGLRLIMKSYHTNSKITPTGKHRPPA